MRNSKKKSMNATILSNTPAPSPRVAWRNEEARNLELTHIRFNEFNLMSDIDSELQEDEIGIKADHPRKLIFLAIYVTFFLCSCNFFSEKKKSARFKICLFGQAKYYVPICKIHVMNLE